MANGSPNAFVNLLTMDGHVLRCTESEPNFVASEVNHRDLHAIIHNNSFALLSTED